MGMIRRRLAWTMALTLAGGAAAAWAVPYEELSGGRKALYTARAAAANVLPVASSLVEPKCLPGYIFCKLAFAAFSVVAAGESMVMSGGADMAQPRAILYRGFAGDWVVTPRDIAGDRKPEVLPEPPPPAGGEEKGSGGFIPPPR